MRLRQGTHYTDTNKLMVGHDDERRRDQSSNEMKTGRGVTTRSTSEEETKCNRSLNLRLGV